MFSYNSKDSVYSFFQESQHKNHKHLPSPSALKLWLLTFGSAKALMTRLYPRMKLWRKATRIFCKVKNVLSSLLETSQGFAAHSQRLFEFTHQWRIKGFDDDRGSIKSRSLEGEGGEGNNMKNSQNGRQPASSRLWDWKLPYVCSSLPRPQWTR